MQVVSRQILLTNSHGTFTGSISSLKMPPPSGDEVAVAGGGAASSTALNNNANDDENRSLEIESNNNQAAAAATAQQLHQRRLLMDIDEDENDASSAATDVFALTSTQLENAKENRKATAGAGSDDEGSDEESDGGGGARSSDKPQIPLPPVFLPLVVVVSSSLDLPEPSFKTFTGQLLRFGVCRHVAACHLRGCEPSSAQAAAANASVTETAMDLLRWIDELHSRGYASDAGGVVIVAAGFEAGMIAESANLLWWARREFALRAAVGSSFWRDSGGGGGGGGSEQQSPADDEARRALMKSRNFLCRGLVFLGSAAPPANVLQQLSFSSLVKWSASAAVLQPPAASGYVSFVASLFRCVAVQLRLWVEMAKLACWCVLALLAPETLIQKRLERVLLNAWKSAYRHSSLSVRSCAAGRARSVARHFARGGTDRRLDGPDCDSRYVSSIRRSVSSPEGVCARALAAKILNFNLFLTGLAERDLFAGLVSIAQRRCELLEQQKNLSIVNNKIKKTVAVTTATASEGAARGEETSQQRSKKKGESDDASLLMLHQLPRLRGEQPPFESVAPGVPVLCVCAPTLATANDLPSSVSLAALKQLDLAPPPSWSGDEEDAEKESTTDASPVEMSSRSSTCAVVYLRHARSEFVHCDHDEGGGDGDADQQRKTPAFLSALITAKFIRRGVQYERYMQHKRNERAAAQEQEEQAAEEVSQHQQQPRHVFVDAVAEMRRRRVEDEAKSGQGELIERAQQQARLFSKSGFE